MTKTTIQKQFLGEFRKLSPAGKGEVSEYTRWLLDTEKQDRLAALSDSHGNRRSKKPLLAIQKWLSNLGFGA